MIKKNINNTIAINKTAYHNYFIEKKINAGISLKGWEVKSLRLKKINITNGYILLKNNEAYIIGISFQPIITIKNINICQRNQKLLLNKKEIELIYGNISKKGYTIVLLSLFWQNAWAKAQIGIAKGKKNYDHRNEIKEKTWKIKKAMILKKSRKYQL